MISVSQAIPDFGKAIAAAVAATLQEVQQEQTKNTQTSENSERVDLSETAWKELLK